ncbi:MAG TPA: dTMP kinase [Rhizomicrobium sp.]|jgi:dTMP kinase|nr:dTMP kinase [Rhizomicrobium sp.]
MNASPARFITFEGGEGTGKSTQAKRLAARLDAHGIKCVLTREPGGSAGAEDIRKLLVEGEPGRWDALTEAMLMFAARTDHVTRTIKPALANGDWVICDRFTDSTYAYQGVGRGLSHETLARIDSVTLESFRPDLTLVLDLPVETGLKRAAQRGGGEARFEKFDVQFHEKLRQAFRDIAAREPHRCVLIDVDGSEDGIAEKIWSAVASRFGL